MPPAGVPSVVDVMRFTPSAHNTTLPPDWRWERARWLREHGKNLRKGGEDPWVTLAVKFQRELAKADSFAAHDRLGKKYPGVYWAWAHHSRPEQNTRWTIEAYLCADTPPAGISDRTGQHVETVAAYAHLFFDVMGRTRHRLFMMNEVLGRSIHYGLHERDYDLLWKLLGLLKGPLMLDLIVLGDDEPGQLTNYNQGSKSVNGMIRSSAEYLTWKTVRTTRVDYNQEVILNFYAKLRDIEAKAESGASTASLLLSNVQAMMVNLGFQFGRPDRHGSPAFLSRHDDAAAEPRAGELLRLAMGDVSCDEAIDNLKFPEVKDGHPAKPGG